MVPQFLKPFLWSYDTKKLDIKKDKIRIITNILNYGTEKATNWLFKTYDKKSIITVLKNPKPGEWDKKSLNFWSFIFKLKLRKSKRRLLNNN